MVYIPDSPGSLSNSSLQKHISVTKGDTNRRKKHMLFHKQFRKKKKNTPSYSVSYIAKIRRELEFKK